MHEEEPTNFVEQDQSPIPPPPIHDGVVNAFERHARRMRDAARARREAVRLRTAVDDVEEQMAVDIRDTFGVPSSQDRWAGCTNLRTLRGLLSIIDDRGFERCYIPCVHMRGRALTNVVLVQIASSTQVSLGV